MGPYFANATDPLVDDALAGFAEAHHELVVHDARQGYVYARRRSASRRVGLVSGGGSGHEPMHLGFVGEGMLDAACPGRIFASPHNRQIFEASCEVAGPDGVLHIVKNYTGDRINFGIAAERLAHRGIPCARVLVDDDLASQSEDIAVGRRGTAATVLIEKVLGAAADKGGGLEDLAALGASLTSRCRTIAVASRAHTSPTTGEPAFTLPPGVLEYGVGIHGERADRSIGQEPLRELLERMAGALLDALAPTPDTPLVVLVNSLGAVTRLELYAVFHEVARVLSERGVTVARSKVGDFTTALDMRGFSLSLLAGDDRTIELFDAPARTAAWYSGLEP
ncbi:dihydroxyacetone kinase subunit DhaK [Streptantibioticus cattleyicolor]|uniref:Glycerone kinase n=1 Tax=Streptantibioticus cattleyicolor (strain ATCC 35852 / DSM 46488 / JCM 4925 / NBRC 14057 / NRRL 8057) TaxID=1003195 RepID=F8JNP3_STREN|nr:dihydroxyacetone kinase subunit DhaK [Streptantibioticus cattleyicolor]AEW98987.1 Glycerone kinase [Streptantibioticus cattleyicolor NRRL 8057 = DSM 46488]CCB71970.1 PTS-dependent dihydroxyacetone kinase, dihydroxyacetone-binding subunit dhaK [Streptantibioticus cattleyicolor NRRL 8057 = DSM 46488]